MSNHKNGKVDPKKHAPAANVVEKDVQKTKQAGAELKTEAIDGKGKAAEAKPPVDKGENGKADEVEVKGVNGKADGAVTKGSNGKADDTADVKADAKADGKAVPERDSKEHLLALVRTFMAAMLVTVDPGGAFHGVPMAVAQVDDSGDLWFATSITSDKAKEIEADSRVLVTMQSSMSYVSLAGEGVIVRDQAKIKELWSESWRVWFPKGPTDADIALVQVKPNQGEFWDQKGTKGLRFLFNAAKAYVAGERGASSAPNQHGEARF